MKRRKFHSKYPETCLQPKAQTRRAEEMCSNAGRSEVDMDEEAKSGGIIKKKKRFVCGLNERTTGQKAGAL